jgi:hypothetical protein
VAIIGESNESETFRERLFDLEDKFSDRNDGFIKFKFNWGYYRVKLYLVRGDTFEVLPDAVIFLVDLQSVESWEKMMKYSIIVRKQFLVPSPFYIFGINGEHPSVDVSRYFAMFPELRVNFFAVSDVPISELFIAVIATAEVYQRSHNMTFTIQPETDGLFHLLSAPLLSKLLSILMKVRSENTPHITEIIPKLKHVVQKISVEALCFIRLKEHTCDSIRSYLQLDQYTALNDKIMEIGLIQFLHYLDDPLLLMIAEDLKILPCGKPEIINLVINEVLVYGFEVFLEYYDCDTLREIKDSLPVNKECINDRRNILLSILESLGIPRDRRIKEHKKQFKEPIVIFTEVIHQPQEKLLTTPAKHSILSHNKHWSPPVSPQNIPSQESARVQHVSPQNIPSQEPTIVPSPQDIPSQETARVKHVSPKYVSSQEPTRVQHASPQDIPSQEPTIVQHVSPQYVPSQESTMVQHVSPQNISTQEPKETLQPFRKIQIGIEDENGNVEIIESTRNTHNTQSLVISQTSTEIFTSPPLVGRNIDYEISNFHTTNEDQLVSPFKHKTDDLPLPSPKRRKENDGLPVSVSSVPVLSSTLDHSVLDHQTTGSIERRRFVKIPRNSPQLSPHISPTPPPPRKIVIKGAPLKNTENL